MTDIPRTARFAAAALTCLAAATAARADYQGWGFSSNTTGADGRAGVYMSFPDAGLRFDPIAFAAVVQTGPADLNVLSASAFWGPSAGGPPGPEVALDGAAFTMALTINDIATGAEAVFPFAGTVSGMVNPAGSTMRLMFSDLSLWMDLNGMRYTVTLGEPTLVGALADQGDGTFVSATPGTVTARVEVEPVPQDTDDPAPPLEDDPAPVPTGETPEPATLALAGVGLGLAELARRRRC